MALARWSGKPIRGPIFEELDRLIADHPEPRAVLLKDARMPHKSRIEQHAATMRERNRRNISIRMTLLRKKRK